MQQNSECKFCRTFACVYMFLLNLNDFTTVNFNKITIIIVKRFKILTNTIIVASGEVIQSPKSLRLRLSEYRLIITSPSVTNC